MPNDRAGSAHPLENRGRWLSAWESQRIQKFQIFQNIKRTTAEPFAKF
jgi:hypothetical protein